MVRTQKSFLQQADWDSQELSWKIMCLTHQNSKFKIQKKWAAERTKNLNAQNTQHSTHKKHWMSWRLWKHEEFTAEEERELFRTSSLTARKQHASTQSESESETPTKRSIRRFNSNEFLFNTSTEPSNMTTMNSFQQQQDESLRSQESQEKSRQESFSSNMISQEWYELKMMKLKLEMMRLEAQKLKY